MRRIGILFLMLCVPAQAGMTYTSLSDAAKARLDVLSFFFFSFLVLALIVKLLWNYLAKDFKKLPKLNYMKALAVMMISGLFFYVALTMISGARELLTPGAWERQGVGYRLRDGAPVTESKELRKQRIERLRDSIWKYAEENEGHPPASPFSGEVPLNEWKLVDGNYYGYIKPESIGSGRDILVYEPSSAGARRYILFTDGSIEDWAEGELHSALKSRYEH